jgi:hypothetical protein
VRCSPWEKPYTEYGRYRYEEEMFFGGRTYIWGILIGLFIILIGVASLLGESIWDKIWPSFIIIVGLAIVVNAFMRRR